MTRMPLTRERLRVGADEITLLVTGEESGGRLLAAEVRLPAGGGPPGLHRHDPDEVYRLERGELAIYLEDERAEVHRIAAGPGDVIHIPGGRPHTVRNESGDEATASVVFAPAAGMERFLRAAAALAADGPPAPADVMRVAAEHGIRFTGPLPAAAQSSKSPA